MDKENDKGTIDNDNLSGDLKSFKEINKEQKDTKKAKAKLANKKNIIIGTIAFVAIFAVVFAIIKLNTPERKINVLSETIEASKKVDLNSLVTVKEEYKDKYEIAAKKIIKLMK